jgi:DNA mismatch endonuclease (patch repair protein)
MPSLDDAVVTPPTMPGKRRRDVPEASSAAALRRMRCARRRDTTPELALRSRLHRLGLRYRVDISPLPGLRRRADLLFPRARVAVFVDGCFWHGCPIHGTWPKANAQWWRSKLEANQRRDHDTDRQLLERGWHVVRIWAHENPDLAAQTVVSVVASCRGKTTVSGIRRSEYGKPPELVLVVP